VQSIVDREEAAILESQPEIEAFLMGGDLPAREVVVLISLNRRSDRSAANITVRGAYPEDSFALRPQLQISAGRRFRSGAAEVVIGKSIARRFAVGGLGETITFGNAPVDHRGHHGLRWERLRIGNLGDVNLVMNSFRRPVYSSVIGPPG